MISSNTGQMMGDRGPKLNILMRELLKCSFTAKQSCYWGVSAIRS